MSIGACGAWLARARAQRSGPRSCTVMPDALNTAFYSPFFFYNSVNYFTIMPDYWRGDSECIHSCLHEIFLWSPHYRLCLMRLIFMVICQKEFGTKIHQRTKWVQRITKSLKAIGLFYNLFKCFLTNLYSGNYLQKKCFSIPILCQNLNLT